MIHNTARLPLPALVSAGAAGDLRSGKQLIGADGSIVTGTMPEVAGKTITPGTTAQTAVAAGRYVTGDVVVAGDANLVPANIAQGVSIFGVTGTHSGGGETVNGSFVSASAKYGATVLVYTGPDGPTWTNGPMTIYNVQILKDSAVYFNTSDAVSTAGGLTAFSRPSGLNSSNYLYKATSDFTVYFEPHTAPVE